MILQPLARKYLVVGAGLLALAVLIGAFGAHGLKSLVTPEKLVTFETGVRYQFYHAFAILLLAFFPVNFPLIKTEASFRCFLLGVLFFSLNCYLYVLTDIKAFALAVPLGGILFVAGWVMLTVRSLRS